MSIIYFIDNILNPYKKGTGEKCKCDICKRKMEIFNHRRDWFEIKGTKYQDVDIVEKITKKGHKITVVFCKKCMKKEVNK